MSKAESLEQKVQRIHLVVFSELRMATILEARSLSKCPCLGQGRNFYVECAER